MEALDLLKKDWNKASYPEFDEKRIYRIMLKKSSSIVKRIFIISILELLFWTMISLFSSTDKVFEKINSDKVEMVLIFLTIFNYAVIVFFIAMFYRNYKTISTTNSVKQLMKDILKARKTVNYYVWYNLGMIVIGMAFGFFIAFRTDSTIRGITNENPNIYWGVIVACVFVCIIFVVLFWLFYKLLYGILLKRLLKNYNELKKIDL